MTTFFSQETLLFAANFSQSNTLITDFIPVLIILLSACLPLGLMRANLFQCRECRTSIRTVRYQLVHTLFFLSQKCWKHSSFPSTGSPVSSSNPSSSFEAKPASGTSHVLPGIDLGLRVCRPSSQFPATLSEGEPLPSNDPRVVWKEHFCSEKGQPYYHNLDTNEVTYAKPPGFVTRFPRWYQQNGIALDHEGINAGSKSTGSGSNEPEHLDSSTARFRQSTASEVDERGTHKTSSDLFLSKSQKQRLAAFGAMGLLWYFIVHNLFLICVFSSMYFLKIDLVRIAHSYGFHVSQSEGKISETGEKRSPSVWKTLITAIVLNKLLVPVQMVVTMGTASKVIPVLRPICKRFSARFSMAGNVTSKHPL